ncbi:sensor histidine kinase [Deinococcus oregonensis]|uniref:histidine kinase n=1 Tax=Deinococcus oregonensis TaxID=1805970 RepID=A0ABV6B6S2_9DEIO
MHNVLKHARATSVRVTLSVGEALELTASDDGVGLSTGRRHGIGLTSMRERAEELGGTLTLTSSPGVGTRIHVTLPLQKGS